MRAEAVVDEVGLPKEVSGPLKVLVGQFLRNPFVNSGGARYLPVFSAEAVLIEDFPEDQEPPATGALLSALGLARRRGLARLEIDDALLENGATVLEQQLLLDPKEFRLVCIPHDLYMRCRSRARLGSAAAVDALRRLPGAEERQAARAGRRGRASRRIERPRQHRDHRPARVRDRPLRRHPPRPPGRPLAAVADHVTSRRRR